MKRLIVSLLSLVLLLNIVSAGQDVLPFPEGKTVDEFKEMVRIANGDDGYYPEDKFSLSTTLRATYISCYSSFPYKCYWGSFSASNPLGNGGCDSSETPSNCILGPDSMSSTECSGVTSDWCCSYSATKYGLGTGINIQCYCTTKQQQCSGGGNPGDRKCSSGSIWECTSGGSWNIVTSCPSGCSGTTCNDAPACTPHSTSRCVGNSVFWFDSCGSQEELRTECNSDETCSGKSCTRVCSANFIGSPFCSENSVAQKWQKEDCSTEDKIQLQCNSNQECNNGVCNDKSCPSNKPSDTQWSSCNNGIMTRTIYYCDTTTNYVWASKNEQQSCGCTKDDDCKNDETCTGDKICEPLKCTEDQIINIHECNNRGVDWGLVLIIALPILFVVALGFIYFKIRNGKRW
jgi:hypothetical protein